MSGKPMPILPRLLRGVPPPTEGDCILSTSKNNKGYGRLSVYNRRSLAHRVAWQIFVGPIPAGLFVLHSCDVPNCINVGHLFLGTHTDNMRDAAAKKRFARQRKTHCKNGHPFVEGNLLHRPDRPNTRICLTCHRANVRRASRRYKAKIRGRR